jgi:hypothetical protein
MDGVTTLPVASSLPLFSFFLLFFERPLVFVYYIIMQKLLGHHKGKESIGIPYP